MGCSAWILGCWAGLLGWDTWLLRLAGLLGLNTGIEYWDWGIGSWDGIMGWDHGMDTWLGYRARLGRKQSLLVVANSSQ